MASRLRRRIGTYFPSAGSVAGTTGGGAVGSAVTGGGTTFTITGSGFGTRSSLTPLFYRFFAPGDFTNGAAASVAGYNAFAVGSPAGVFVDTSTSYVSGYGCLKHETASSGVESDSFPHLYPTLSGLSERQIYQTFYFRSERTAGSGSVARQIKGPRYAYSTEYSGSPRIISSMWIPEDFSSYGYTQCGFFDAGGTDYSNSDGGASAYKSTWQASDWNMIESWADFGTVGASDGFHKIWLNGVQMPAIAFDNVGHPELNTNTMPVRSSSAHLINYVSTFPGVDRIQAGNRFRFRWCEHVVDTTPARVVIGNAATWGSCTRKQYMIPTAWSNTSVTATWRTLGFATSGQTVYGYVVNSSGTVSAATALTVP